MFEQEFNNYLPLNRRFFNNFLWKQPRVFSKAEAWLDMIQTARFEDDTKKEVIDGQVIEWGRGQFPGSLRFLAKRWGWSTTKVKNFLTLCESENMISINQKNVTATTVITVCKYNVYNMDAEKRKQARNSGVTTTKQGRNKTNKDINKDNNVEEVKTEPLLIKTDEDVLFEKFTSWIKENAPRVAEMPEPISFKQFLTIQKKYSSPELKDRVFYKLKKMHDWPPLLKKRVSAFLTLDDWMQSPDYNKAPVIQLSSNEKTSREQSGERLINAL